MDSSAGVITAAGCDVEVLCSGRESHGRGTFTSSVDLAAAEQGVAQQVRQPTVEVQRGQAALETFSGGHQLGQVVVHARTQSCDEEVACGQTSRGHRYSKSDVKARGSEVLPTFQVQVLGTVDALAGGRLVHFQCVCVAIVPTDGHIVPLVVI